ncbi:MAG TPA: dihydrodipicolinate synthase family protein [Planctomycetes bacterium]|nr:dihydrodipicolinate synthase family protein [Planctomycetota bacterium]
MTQSSVRLPEGGELIIEGNLLLPFEEELAELGDSPPPVRKSWAALQVVVQGEYATTGHSLTTPGSHEEIGKFLDWEATTELRRNLGAQGFGVAEAMDTAQRFFLGWENARQLIENTAALDLPLGFVAGASYDHCPSPSSLDELCDSVSFQARAIADLGGVPVILPMPWLCEMECGPEDFVVAYRKILESLDCSVYLHWLGPMFLPVLEGYFPSDSFQRIMALNREQVLGVKISLLDPVREVAIRRSLAEHGQETLTGDDFNFASLIAGDEKGFSHALLGILGGISRPASLAFQFLAHGAEDKFRQLMNPCEVLSRAVFESPTQHYKAGLAFLSWLDGQQPNAMLVNREDLARDKNHLLRLVELAIAAGVFTRPDCVAENFSSWLGTD